MPAHTFPTSVNTFMPLALQACADAGLVVSYAEFYNGVYVEAETFDGVDMEALQTAIEAVPAQSALVEDQWAIEVLPRPQRAIALVTLDEVTLAASAPTTYTAPTPAAFWQAVKDKIATL